MRPEEIAREVFSASDYLCKNGHRDDASIPAPRVVDLLVGYSEEILRRTQSEAVRTEGVTPIDMVLYCPSCGYQHIDAPDERTPDWKNPPHKSHLCHHCKAIWRPCDFPTNGVAQIETRGKADTFVPGQLPFAAVPLPQHAQSVVVEALRELMGHCNKLYAEFGVKTCIELQPAGRRAQAVLDALATPSIPAPVAESELREDDTPANVDRMDERGFVTWASSEEGGGPDVGITVGLGAEQGHLWLGEITRKRWEDIGGNDFSDNDMGWWLIHYAPGKEPDVLAKALQPDHDPLREFLEHTLAPMLAMSSLATVPSMQTEKGNG